MSNSQHRHPVWIFDLDDTLHHATPRIFPHINRTMTDYLMQHLQLDEAGANHLRVDYWHRYGATLNGMMRHHGTDPHHFLRATHPIDLLAPLARRVSGLHALLHRLPGRKYIFTNGPRHYAHALLKSMRLLSLFDGIIGIEAMGFHPKPQPQGYYRLLRRHRLTAAHCIMVDDNHDNIVTARRLGMRGIWLGQRHQANSRLPRIRRLLQLRRGRHATRP